MTGSRKKVRQALDKQQSGSRQAVIRQILYTDSYRHSVGRQLDRQQAGSRQAVIRQILYTDSRPSVERQLDRQRIDSTCYTPTSGLLKL